MKDNDKTLIVAYLDGETTDQETTYVNKLIKDDQDAYEYMEEMKAVNIELNNAKESQDLKDLKAWNEKFYKEKIAPKLSKSTNPSDKKSFFDVVTIGFNSVAVRHVIGYALTATLFVGIGANFINNQSVSGLQGFNSTNTITLEFPKFRSQEADSLKDKLQITLDEMLEQKTLNARFIWGSDSYFVNIKTVTYPSNKAPCYLGDIVEGGIETEFLYCVAEKDKTITFTG